MTDEQLIQAGDWPAIFDRYREPLANYLAIRAPAAAEDLAQTVFLTVYGTEWPEGWLFRPVLYTVADRLTQQYRKRMRRERRRFAEYAGTM